GHRHQRPPVHRLRRALGPAARRRPAALSRARPRRRRRLAPRVVGEFQIFIATLLVSVAVLNALANWLKVPYPIILVIGGLALGLVPGDDRGGRGARPPGDRDAARARLRAWRDLRPDRRRRRHLDPAPARGAAPDG